MLGGLICDPPSFTIIRAISPFSAVTRDSRKGPSITEYGLYDETKSCDTMGSEHFTQDSRKTMDSAMLAASHLRQPLLADVCWTVSPLSANIQCSAK